MAIAKNGFIGALAAAAAIGTGGEAAAQTYPSRPVTLVYPYAAGSGPDTAWRTLAAEARQVLGQPVVYENRAGAGGTVGLDSVLRGANDGYLIGVVNNPLLVTQPLIDPARRIEPGKDYAPVIHAIDIYQVLAVHPALPVRSVAELVAHAKANPGKLNFSSAGPGVQSHVGVERFARVAGISLVHVPYKGEAPGVTALVAGEVQLAMPSATAKPFIDSGKLRGIATTGPRRWHLHPDLPTLDESGYKGFVSSTWMGVVAPPGTSREAVAKLNAAFSAALKSTDVQGRLEKLGFQVVGSTPDGLASLIRSDLEAWAPVMREAGIKLN